MHMLSFTAVKRYGVLLLSALALAVLALGQSLGTLAHESRDVGEYRFTVGFVNEPAIQGDTNGIWLRVLSDDEPVTGVGDTLSAEVIFGDQSREFTLTPVWGEEGVYQAMFIPTEPGDYTFRFFGQIGELDVDESFTSSPEGFDSVVARAEIEFPAAEGSTAVVAMPLAVAAVVMVAGAFWLIARRREV